MIRRKRNPLILAAHAAVVLATAIIALGNWPATLLIILLVTHVAMDSIKVYVLKDTLRAFVLDQSVHLVVIAGLAVAYPRTVERGLWSELPAGGFEAYAAALCLLAGLIASLQVGGIIIRKATARFTAETNDEIQGLENGGLYIGFLERALIMILILMGHPSGVGFLIAAKSILRFGEVREPSQRKMTEYIIIGTFMSFGWGLLVAVLTQLGLAFVLS
jgi:hypothetical protein